ncbi:hypothetical protein CPC08DRAFT_70260 [Agrocybe pediades]|nr:hypothetical protein CPC08DRAFT_70260 [Agrocybe pediades]
MGSCLPKPRRPKGWSSLIRERDLPVLPLQPSRHALSRPLLSTPTPTMEEPSQGSRFDTVDGRLFESIRAFCFHALMWPIFHFLHSISFTSHTTVL